MIDNLLFPTFVVGSLPRPRFIRDLIEDRRDGRVSVSDADRFLDSAIPLAVSMQERAGLTYVSDGEWRRESYIKVFSEHVDGFRLEALRVVVAVREGCRRGVMSIRTHHRTQHVKQGRFAVTPCPVKDE